jgi:SIR2-like protein
VTAEQLIELLRAERTHVLPFVGSGMTVGAGAPSTQALTRDLARRCGVSFPPGASLTDVTQAAEVALGVSTVQKRLAEMVTGWRLRPTPALTALCAVPKGRLLTTNYDDGIERSARSRGIEPVPLLPDDVRMLQAPKEKDLQVVHLHGVPADPGTLVLPGRGMSELASNEVRDRADLSDAQLPRSLRARDPGPHARLSCHGSPPHIRGSGARSGSLDPTSGREEVAPRASERGR